MIRCTVLSILLEKRLLEKRYISGIMCFILICVNLVAQGNAGTDKYLKSLSPDGQRTNAEIWVSKIPAYPVVASMILPRYSYSNTYILQKTNTNIYRSNETTITTTYLSTDKKAHVQFLITRYEKATDAQKAWLAILGSNTNPNMRRAIEDGIAVGDIAFGTTRHLIFIRANMLVDISVKSSDNDGFSIVEMAKEIEQQILDSIAK